MWYIYTYIHTNIHLTYLSYNAVYTYLHHSMSLSTHIYHSTDGCIYMYTVCTGRSGADDEQTRLLHVLLRSYLQVLCPGQRKCSGYHSLQRQPQQQQQLISHRRKESVRTSLQARTDRVLFSFRRCSGWGLSQPAEELYLGVVSNSLGHTTCLLYNSSIHPSIHSSNLSMHPSIHAMHPSHLSTQPLSQG